MDKKGGRGNANGGDVVQQPWLAARGASVINSPDSTQRSYGGTSRQTRSPKLRPDQSTIKP